MVCFTINSLPNNKILDVTKLKAFADNKINVAQVMISVFDRVENIVGKGENAGYQHFLLFPRFQLAGWLVVLGFNATLTAKVISWRSVTHVFTGYLMPL